MKTHSLPIGRPRVFSPVIRFLRSQVRKKDGKEHTYWSVVKNKHLLDGRVAQRQVLYLGEVNDSQRAAWRKTLDAHSSDSNTTSQIALFPHDHTVPADDARVVQIRLDQLSLQRPRQWGGCWLALELYRQLGLDTFFAQHLPASRKGTRWDRILRVLVNGYSRPGRSGICIAIGSSAPRWPTCSARISSGRNPQALCHAGSSVAAQGKLFDYLRDKWRDLFGATYEVLLYDLTSTYFETDTPDDPDGPRRHGYSRDYRPSGHRAGGHA